MGPLRSIAIAACLSIVGCASSGPDPVAVEVPDQPSEGVYRSARDHPDWAETMGLCDRAMLNAADSAPYGTAQRLLGAESAGDLRTSVCELLLQCQWEETGLPVFEFTVASRQAYDACYELVFRSLNSRLDP